LVGNNFHLVNGDREFFIKYRDPESEIRIELPFKIEDGIPIVGKGNVALDTHIKFRRSYFKELTSIAKVLNTEFFTFTFEDSFSVTVGELHDVSHKTKLNIDCEFCGPKHVESVYTYGMKEMGMGFLDNLPVNLMFTSDAPGWFYQNSKDHVLGVFIPPYEEQEVVYHDKTMCYICKTNEAETTYQTVPIPGEPEFPVCSKCLQSLEKKKDEKEKEVKK